MQIYKYRIYIIILFTYLEVNFRIVFGITFFEILIGFRFYWNFFIHSNFANLKTNKQKQLQLRVNTVQILIKFCKILGG